MTKYYRVWLETEYLKKFPLFDKIDESTLETWLHGAAECYGGVWWIDASNSENEAHGIPYNRMGYIVKFEEL